MKVLYSIFLLLSYPLFCRAQFVIDSTRFITGYKPGVLINYTIPTTDRGILFVGEEYGNPGGIIPYFPIDTGIDGNVFIGKIDSNQQISWIRVYGGSQGDAAGSVCQTPDGGYAVLCGTASNDGDVTGYRGGGGDLWLIRLDANGNLLWEQTYGSTAQDAPTSIANTPDHGFIMSGITNGSDDEVPFHYGNFYTFDWLVIKTDSMGNFIWSKDLGTSNDEGSTGAILSIDSSYYLISNTGTLDHDCTDTTWHTGVPTGFDLYVLKLNDTGKVLWDSSYGGTQTDGANAAFFDTRDSTIVINGFTYSDDYMVTGYQGNGDMWVVKVDKNGKLLWEKTLGSPNMENGTGICAGPDGGYIAYGDTYPGPIGYYDCWLFELDSTGNILSNNVFGGVNLDKSVSVLPYLNGYVTTGLSGSDSFTDGTIYGDFDNVGGAFVSYVDLETLGLNNINKTEKQLVVYPNPTNGYIKIIVPVNEIGNIMIINSIGQVAYAENIKQQTRYIDVNTMEWAIGLYLVKLQCEDGSVLTAKFIKN